MSIRLDGVNDVLESLEGIVDEEKLKIALGKACAIVERSAKQKAPKGNGDLRGSIKSHVKDKSGLIFTEKEYAPYVEYGTGLFAEDGGRQDVPWVYKDDQGEYHTTSGIPPHPFMRPALNENRARIIKIFKENLKND